MATPPAWSSESYVVCVALAVLFPVPVADVTLPVLRFAVVVGSSELSSDEEAVVVASDESVLVTVLSDVLVGVGEFLAALEKTLLVMLQRLPILSFSNSENVENILVEPSSCRTTSASTSGSQPGHADARGAKARAAVKI